MKLHRRIYLIRMICHLVEKMGHFQERQSFLIVQLSALAKILCAGGL